MAKTTIIQRQNAVKNILLGKITLSVSCLAEKEQKCLVAAVNAYAINKVILTKNRLYYDVLEQVFGIRKLQKSFADCIEQFYHQVQEFDNGEQELKLSRIIIAKKYCVDKSTSDSSKRQRGELQRQIQQNLKAESERKHYEELIAEQQRASEEYFANYTPYKQTHNRRFDFEVKNQRKTTEQFQEELQPIFGDNLVCKEYVNAKTLAQMYCRKHDHPFTRMPLHLLKGYGCPHCNKEEGKTWANTVTAKYDPSKRNDRWTTERFIQESINRFGEGVFDYSKVNYVNNDTRVTIIRMKDGKKMNVFPYEHLRRDEDYDGEQKYYEGKTDEEKIHLIVRHIKEHIDQPVYVPMQSIPDASKRIRLICPQHGEFYATVAQIKNSSCCPDCDNMAESIGERNVRRYLKDLGVNAIPEFVIRNKKYFRTFVRVDFFLPDQKTIIEFNGEQHYGIGNDGITHNKRSYAEQAKRDMQLRRYAADHGLQLIEVPYQFRNDVALFLDHYKLA